MGFYCISVITGCPNVSLHRNSWNILMIFNFYSGDILTCYGSLEVIG